MLTLHIRRRSLQSWLIVSCNCRHSASSFRLFSFIYTLIENTSLQSDHLTIVRLHRIVPILTLISLESCVQDSSALLEVSCQYFARPIAKLGLVS